MKRILVGGVGLLVSICLAGCGDGKGSVSGSVTYDGKPVPNGTITFVKLEGGGGREGGIIDGGKYVAKVPPGKYKVELNAQKVTGKRKQKDFDGKDEEVEITEELFPERFNTKTELMKEIKAGSNLIDFDLKSKP